METPNFMIEQALGRYVASSGKYMLGVIRDIYWIGQVMLVIATWSVIYVRVISCVVVFSGSSLIYRCLYRTENPVVWDSHLYLFTCFSDAGCYTDENGKPVVRVPINDPYSWVKGEVREIVSLFRDLDSIAELGDPSVWVQEGGGK
ncbi:hypothetical protein PIB30_084683 [Stylosanthes scabra]|uniref:Uncharacterized protein n=1 Tax=Stylosanthes scabra TaxID=79078 RepID=A0ABU6RSH1_9FABA|nr:hypothetical protein [Stylosanthes scabra]